MKITKTWFKTEIEVTTDELKYLKDQGVVSETYLDSLFGILNFIKDIKRTL